MARAWRVVLAAWMLLGLGPQSVWAETVDGSAPIGASGRIGATASMTVTPITISSNTPTTAVSFGDPVTVGPTNWVVGLQYLRIVYQSNATAWAVRIYTDNTTAHPTEAAGFGVCANDRFYSGLIGTTPTNVLDRGPVGWQAYNNPIVGGPAAPSDTTVGGNFDSPWAFVADKSDLFEPRTTSGACTGSPATPTDLTGEFVKVVNGAGATQFLTQHPSPANTVADGDIAVYLAGRFGGLGADTYDATLILELYHL